MHKRKIAVSSKPAMYLVCQAPNQTHTRRVVRVTLPTAFLLHAFEKSKVNLTTVFERFGQCQRSSAFMYPESTKTCSPTESPEEKCFGRETVEWTASVLNIGHYRKQAPSPDALKSHYDFLYEYNVVT
jgi:hypothetical protein